MAGKDCALCQAVGTGDNDFSVFVCDGQFSEVRLERRSRLAGYCLVVWKQGHAAEPTDLEPRAAAGYWQDVLQVGKAVWSRFNPVKLNYFTLGNTVPHLHTHIVPRYLNDPAPAGPIAWEAMFRPDPVPDAELQEQARDLRHLLHSDTT